MAEDKTTTTLVWMKLNVQSFLDSEDVDMMTDSEVGQYCLLLFWAWKLGKNCTLPNDPKWLAKKAHCDEVSTRVMSKFLTDESGRIFNKVEQDTFVSQLNIAMKKIDNSPQRVSASRNNGQLGGRPRKTQEEPEGKPRNNPRETREEPEKPEGLGLGLGLNKEEYSIDNSLDANVDSRYCDHGLRSKCFNEECKNPSIKPVRSNKIGFNPYEVEVPGFSTEEVKFVVNYHWNYSQKPFWRDLRISDANFFIRNFPKMAAAIPYDWKPPVSKNKVKPNPKCEVCSGEGGTWKEPFPGKPKVFEDCSCISK